MPVEKGEEVHISYGSHPSDFLFVECKSESATGNSNRTTSNLETDGFFPDDNPSDAVYLDDIILQQLTENEKDSLELRQFYGYASPQYKCLVSCSAIRANTQLPTNQ